jgi:hypothetical protein
MERIKRALLKCKTYSHCFGETHGTPFFGLNTSMDEVCRTLAERKGLQEKKERKTR